MNPQTESAALDLVAAVKKDLGRVAKKMDVVIAAPALFLPALRAGLKKTAIQLGSQDVSSEKMGAFTGEVSALMQKSIGVSYAIIGHSERRARGETEEYIEKKISQVLKAEMTAILCVGERVRDLHGKYFTVVEQEIRSALKAVPSTKLPNIAIAYEPIWAISTSTPGARAATPEDAHEMVLFIRKVLTDMYGRAAAERVRILYGGSVDAKNIEILVARSGAQGYLVGGASLRPQDVATICSAVS